MMRPAREQRDESNTTRSLVIIRSNLMKSRQMTLITILSVLITMMMSSVKAHITITNLRAKVPDAQDAIANHSIHSEVTAEFEMCLNEKYFNDYVSSCDDNRKQIREELEKCETNKEHVGKCRMLLYQVQVHLGQCNDITYYTQHFSTCGNQRRHSRIQYERCSNGEYKQLCEATVPYYIQQSLEECGRSDASTCENIIVMMDNYAHSCEAPHYIESNLKACEDHMAYMKRQQERCSDASFALQRPMICKYIEYHTKEEEKRCVDRTYYSENANACDDNSHFYIQQKVVRCSNPDYYILNHWECTVDIAYSFDLLSYCDFPVYYRQHERGCDVQRFYIQTAQKACNDATYYMLNIQYCEYERYNTQTLQEKCNLKEYFSYHKHSCGDNSHYLLQQIQEQCKDTTYYSANSSECVYIVEKNQNQLGKCDDSYYFNNHQQACENHRYYNEKRQEECSHRYYNNGNKSRNCEYLAASAHELVKHCQLPPYYTMHKKACDEAEKYADMDKSTSNSQSSPNSQNLDSQNVDNSTKRQRSPKDIEKLEFRLSHDFSQIASQSKQQQKETFSEEHPHIVSPATRVGPTVEYTEHPNRTILAEKMGIFSDHRTSDGNAINATPTIEIYNRSNEVENTNEIDIHSEKGL